MLNRISWRLNTKVKCRQSWRRVSGNRGGNSRPSAAGAAAPFSTSGGAVCADLPEDRHPDRERRRQPGRGQGPGPLHPVRGADAGRGQRAQAPAFTKYKQERTAGCSGTDQFSCGGSGGCGGRLQKQANGVAGAVAEAPTIGGSDRTNNSYSAKTTAQTPARRERRRRRRDRRWGLAGPVDTFVFVLGALTV